jgi:hypothetical protein
MGTDDSVASTRRTMDLESALEAASFQFREYPAFMDNIFKIELVNDNEYAVQSEAEGQTVESLFRTDPDFLERIGLAEADAKRVVEETARFLAEHQSVIDFPSVVDLEDIAAAYEDYPQQLRKRLEIK